MKTLLFIALCAKLCMATPCQVSDGTCVADYPVRRINPEPFDPIARKTMTVTAVIGSSETFHGQ